MHLLFLRKVFDYFMAQRMKEKETKSSEKKGATIISNHAQRYFRSFRLPQKHNYVQERYDLLPLEDFFVGSYKGIIFKIFGFPKKFEVRKAIHRIDQGNFEQPGNKNKIVSMNPYETIF